jgi:hypothetical protein
MACPHCKAMSGTPRRVHTERDTLTLDLACGGCAHEWSISAVSPSLFLRARPDRRKAPRSEKSGG